MYVVYADHRSDWFSRPVALARDEATARQLLTSAAAELCVVGSDVIRCRLRSQTLTPAEVVAIVRGWAFDDADAGLTEDEATAEAGGRLPEELRPVYLAAFRLARQGTQRPPGSTPTPRAGPTPASPPDAS